MVQYMYAVMQNKTKKVHKKNPCYFIVHIKLENFQRNLKCDHLNKSSQLVLCQTGKEKVHAKRLHHYNKSY